MMEEFAAVLFISFITSPDEHTLYTVYIYHPVCSYYEQKKTT
jgi:hypothetical protein